ncbi:MULTISPECIES: NADH-quinone oxidoreductase subunit NuoG [Deefgea]|uniref:NADH-quinone oxidoreductase n=1 Tax=Deefgea chitinilytica TaxID=570276 RepID=A0ABS2CAJ7_9NEIS|nr:MULTISPECIES: NADH-quinone oxidoreductase subunit NuoG [Deefgea]MBM5571169.1 NADH-quinone oxidoreductase subunit G [Deefgea chitinilytica]MBM9888401.1 NADH-quinone oxidoreductase subunit G [Deefgea sp. CFH1-16]
MLEIEIDGKKLTVPGGSTVMDAANSIGVHIPHFCYHKKLSIAANCRMCLVQVEKAPKPLPACATPVTDGMKVFTHSDQAVTAQKGVMEFLLINHPLDCPICDQGGECTLQDLAVGYGQTGSVYSEEKRVVANKDFGSLISTDMTRCIHCSRCVRFTEEIAGFQELGMANRGEFTEVMPFIGKTVNSEISGNVIDLCPVGALTSKPFRYTARTWELSRRKSVAPHDGLGSNLVVQVKNNKVMRVLPLENEAINECWLSDRDRYSYEALNSEERLTQPMLKQGGVWQTTDWQTALEYVANGLKQVVAEHGKDSVAAVASPNSTVEELFSLRKLMAGLGVDAVQAFARQADFSAKTQGAKWLGQSIEELAQNEAVLLVGSTIRKEQPLLAQRLRQSVKKGLGLSLVNVHGDELLTKLAGEVIVRPDQLVEGLLQVVKALVELKSTSAPAGIELASVEVTDAARAIAKSFDGKEKSAILLGNIAQQSARFAEIYAVAEALATLTGAKLGVPAISANSVGAELIGADIGGNVFESGKKAYVFLGVEPEYDAHNGAQALAAAKNAEMVVMMSPFQSCAMDYADVILPVSPFSETSGTFVNMEGKAQSFNGVVRPLGETRPAWKVFRVLGNILGFNGFDYNSSEEIRDEALAGEISTRLNNALVQPIAVNAQTAQGLVRLGEVPLYQADSVVRRAPSLQATADAAQASTLRANSATLAKLSLVAGDKAIVKQGQGSAELTVAVDDGLVDDVIRAATSHPLTRNLGDMVGAVEVLKG